MTTRPLPRLLPFVILCVGVLQVQADMLLVWPPSPGPRPWRPKAFVNIEIAERGSGVPYRLQGMDKDIGGVRAILASVRDQPAFAEDNLIVVWYDAAKETGTVQDLVALLQALRTDSPFSRVELVRGEIVPDKGSRYVTETGAPPPIYREDVSFLIDLAPISPDALTSGHGKVVQGSPGSDQRTADPHVAARLGQCFGGSRLRFGAYTGRGRAQAPKDKCAVRQSGYWAEIDPLDGLTLAGMCSPMPTEDCGTPSGCKWWV